MSEHRAPPVLPKLLMAPAAIFVKVASQGGLLLLLAMFAAMFWRNGSAGETYEALWGTKIHVGIDGGGLDLSLLGWINDAAMAVFFLVVGAEIKLELVSGELRGVKRAIVPALAAIGGMLIPAGVYLLVASHHREGFGTPMATDIAFSLAAIRVLGARVPDFVVKVLMGLAIIDDLGAIVVIAFFYGGDVHTEALAIAGGLTVLMIGMNLLGVWRVTPYIIVGVPLWYFVHHAGIHPTIAGVIVGMCIPARGIVSVDDVCAEARSLMHYASTEADKPEDGDAHSALSSLERRLEQHQPPLERLVRGLNPWISWIILPLFALANGGVDLAGMTLATLKEPVALGIILGLVVGKVVGVFGTLFACVRVGLLPLPKGVTFYHLLGMAALAGIGFTMSLFVAALAFSDPHLHNEAKAGILVGSTLAAFLGMTILRFAPAAKAADVDTARASDKDGEGDADDADDGDKRKHDKADETKADGQGAIAGKDHGGGADTASADASGGSSAGSSDDSEEPGTP